MASWIEEVPVAELVDGENYFIAKKHLDAYDRPHYMYLGQGLNGKQQWTIKPGIAIHVVCGDKLRDYLALDAAFCALKIPADHATRWTARKKRYF